MVPLSKSRSYTALEKFNLLLRFHILKKKDDTKNKMRFRIFCQKMDKLQSIGKTKQNLKIFFFLIGKTKPKDGYNYIEKIIHAASKKR